MKRMMRMYEEYFYENLLESYNKPHRDNSKYAKYDKDIEQSSLTESQAPQSGDNPNNEIKIENK